jgi:NADH-quinone oxidoreductase subunit H
MLMSIGWKWLLPLSLINVVITAVVVVLVPDRMVQSIVLLVLGIAILAGATIINTNSRTNRLKLMQTRMEMRR